MNAIPKSANKGFTVVELLIAGAVLTIMLGALAAFFAQHTQVTRRTQARNEVETKVRTVAELVAQDLEIAGSKVVVNNGVSSAVDMPCSAATETKCIADPAGTEQKLTLYYATSLRAPSPCRRIDYRLAADGTLQRSELARSGVDCKQLLGLTPVFNLNPIANNITAFDLTYQCADGDTATDPAVCYIDDPATVDDDSSFPRQATITVAGASDNLADITATVTLTATMPNLKR